VTLPTILIADDDRSIRTVLTQALGRAGYQVRSSSNAAGLWRWVEEGEGDLVITDVVMPDENGLDLIPRIKRIRPDLRIIVMSAQSTLMTAVKAAQRGAFEYLPKPFDLAELLAVVRRALAAPSEPSAIVSEPRDSEERLPLIGRSAAMQEIYRTIARLTTADLTVMINGESGTGKELVARALHDYGKRRAGPFVPINMAAIPRELIESELFGHERGAFTGAVKQSIGKIETANKGTLFLDEIGDLPHPLQVKLLRFLQDQIVERIGGRQKIQVDVRIVSATNASLEEKIAQGVFRGDLFYRMNAVTVRIPPLRDRGGDATLLANYFLSRFNQEFGRNIRGFSEAAGAAIAAHAWPGNVRELENRMKRAVVMTEQRVIDASDLELAPPAEGPPDLDLRAARLRAEREVVHIAWARSNHTLSVAARLLGISRPTLYGLLEVHGIEVDGGKGTDTGADAAGGVQVA
jgi:two-component system nitrogen regulation response regulator GlnG